MPNRPTFSAILVGCNDLGPNTQRMLACILELSPRPSHPSHESLYGHPDSGGHWEKHCERQLDKCGFVAIGNWRSVYWHAAKSLLLMVYVDDFKLGGPKEHLSSMWKELRGLIQMDQPALVGRC